MKHGSHSAVKPEAKASSKRSAPRGKAGPAAPGTRQLRVAEEIRHVLAGIFARNPFRDPDLTDAQITVTEVRISPDLRNATAFVTRLGRSDVALLLPALPQAPTEKVFWFFFSKKNRFLAFPFWAALR